jgi:hypothetical protein
VFTPVILATEEAEIRRIPVQSQLGEIVRETLSQKNPSQEKGWQSGEGPEFKSQDKMQSAEPSGLIYICYKYMHFYIHIQNIKKIYKTQTLRSVGRERREVEVRVAAYSFCLLVFLFLWQCRRLNSGLLHMLGRCSTS